MQHHENKLPLAWPSGNNISSMYTN